VGEDPVLLATVEVGKHQDVEQLGAGSRTKCVETLPKAALELLQVHGIGREHRTWTGLDPRLPQILRAVLVGMLGEEQRGV
jgi:hypothetical protein